MSTPELRKDPVLGHWVLVPATVSEDAAPSCVACARIGELGDARVGAVAHPSPVFDRRSVVDRSRSADELYTTMTGAGEHELIIETKQHGVSMAELEVEQIREVLAVWRERFVFFRQDNRFRHMVIVKREGPGIEHACSEAFALPLVPPSLKEKLHGIVGHHKRSGTCVYCDVIRHERTEKKSRRVAESMRHIAIAPYASRSPFEMLVLPKGHHFDFAESSDADLADLAALLSEVLQRLRCVVDDGAFVLYVQSAPPDMGADLQQFHWHFEIHPRVHFAEALRGILDVNPIPPEEAARLLREVVL